MLELKNITNVFDDFEIEDITLKINRNEYFVILGISGVGKSVLLETIAGFINPVIGKIILNNKDITLEKIQKRNIGFVHQAQSLFPHLNVYKNISYGLKNRNLSIREIKEKILTIAEDFEIGNLLKRKPETLSGGEYQRVSLARAIVINPDCILLDEPLSSLDIKSRSKIRALLRKIHRKGITIIHITHDYEEAVSLATRIAVMEKGKIIQVDTPENIFKHPKSEFIARFIGIKNFLKGELEYNENSDAAKFLINNLTFYCLTDVKPGKGYLMIRSKDIVLSMSSPKSSALNIYKGKITDIIPANPGMEIAVDIGVELMALITKKSLVSLGLEIGSNVWITFKASAGIFYEE